MSDRTREEILAAAIARHDLLYGRDHCDRKYIMSCSRLPEIILNLPREVGERDG